MDKEIILQIIGLILGGFCTFVLGLIAAGIKSLIKSILDAKKEIAVFRAQMKFLFKETKKIPKLEKDIDEFHAWKRAHQKQRGKRC